LWLRVRLPRFLSLVRGMIWERTLCTPFPSSQARRNRLAWKHTRTIRPRRCPDQSYLAHLAQSRVDYLALYHVALRCEYATLVSVTRNEPALSPELTRAGDSEQAVPINGCVHRCANVECRRVHRCKHYTHVLDAMDSSSVLGDLGARCELVAWISRISAISP